MKEINCYCGNRLAKGAKSSSVQDQKQRRFVIYAHTTSGMSVLQEKIP